MMKKQIPSIGTECDPSHHAYELFHKIRVSMLKYACVYRRRGCGSEETTPQFKSILNPSSSRAQSLN